MQKLHKKLQFLGLTEKEASTYLTLLELGDANLADITRQTKLKRTTLYEVIRSLKEKGLVSTIRSHSRLIYTAEDPRTLSDRLDEQRAVLDGMLPEMLSLTNALPRKPRMQYYEGIEGIKEVYRDTLEYPDQELLAWVSEEAGKSFDTDFLNNIYLPGRIKNKIWVRAIVSDTPQMHELLGNDATALRHTKAVSHEQFPYTMQINLYGKRRVAFMSFREQTGLIIENESIYNTLKSIFEQQWLSLH
jgi:sugar-specific transcriptional regulator TrmB